MFRRILTLTLLLLGLIGGVANRCVASAAGMTSVPKPFFFTENKGQWDARVLYKCQAKNGMTWFLERDGITLLVSKEDRTKEAIVNPMERDLPEMLRRHPARFPMKSHALKFKFLKGEGSKVKGEGLKVNGERSTKNNSKNLDQSFSTLHPTPYTLHQSFSTLHRASAQSVEPNGELPWKNNYFLGNDSTKWAPNCRNFATVVYRDVWEGIDIEWYENDGKLEFDFVVHPGFDPSQIRMSVEGLEGDRISGFGDQESLLSLRERPAPKQSHLDNGNREQETWNSRGVPRTPAGNVRDLLRDSRTTEGTVHRTFLSDGVKDNSRGVWHTPDTTETMRADMGVRPYPSPNTQPPSPIAQSPLPITELLLPTSLGELRTALPSVYQLSSNGTRNEIEAAFELTDKNTFGITLPNGYNPDHSLRIDPLIYSTFLGGFGNDYASDACVVNNTEVIVAGSTNSENFPITPGVYDPVNSNNNSDGFITHLNADGSQMLFSTYLGGGGTDGCENILLDDVGNIVVSGTTSYGSFPTTYRFGPLGGAGDGFIAKMNGNGSALLFCTVFGSSGAENLPGMASDGSGGFYVTGSTAGTGFPTTTNAYDTSFNGGVYDCYVLRINSTGNQLLFSTFLGGSQNDFGNGVCIDSGGNVWISGGTLSTDFPITIDAFDTTSNGGEDCFITKLSTTGSQLAYSSYIGGNGNETGSKLAQDDSGHVIMIGYTTSNNFPTTPFAYDTTYNGGEDVFVVKLNINGNQVFFSTYLGGQANDLAGSFSLINNNILISGYTGSSNFPVTQFGFDPTYNGGTADCFLLLLNQDGSRLIYSTYVGGTSDDKGRKALVDNVGNIIIVGTTSSFNFPTTVGVFDTSYNGGNFDAFITKIHIDTVDATPEPFVLPETYSLSQNYPNPFNSSTSISYSLPEPGHVDLRLFDITGREVTTLVNQKQQTGSYRVTLDGQHLSSGTYFVRMQAGEFVKTQKMVLLR
ncbi:MAG: T9SS type A sorting domain-containing protein [bacterium]|nr:T9SS type A sorting domain-containing protein [bacterium]